MPTCVGADVYRLRPYATVDLDILVGEPGAELSDLGDAALEELLPASARVDGHDEEHVRCLGDLVRDCCRGRVRGDGDAGLHL